VATLQPVVHMSRGIEKLHHLCKLLHRVAALYVEAKSSALRQDDEEDRDMAMVGNDLDMYLSQLGFMPPPSAENTISGMESGDGMGSGAPGPAQPADWFSGNRYIMGFMEEDLLDFDAMA
jgi:hypothetical protein